VSEHERALLEIGRLVAERFLQSAKRYERCGSDWHLRMPGHWPMELSLPVGLCRAVANCRTIVEKQPQAVDSKDTS
jgi:hypothetical protein